MAAAASVPIELDFNSMGPDQQIDKLGTEKSKLDAWIEEIPETGLKTIIGQVSSFIQVLLNLGINTIRFMAEMRGKVDNCETN